jgi:anti-sigma regulatory factor (Ser/Thr protein kinase)
VKEKLSETRIPSFWTLQLGGWGLYCVLAAVATIPVEHSRNYLADRATFMLGEFLKSFVMYALCHALWRRQTPLLRSLLACLALACPLGIVYQAAWVWAEIHLGVVSMKLQWGSVFTEGIGSSFVLMAWCAFYFGVKYHQATERQRIQLAASELLAQQAQLRALRYQLQPHFLFNTLNAISTLVLDNEPRTASQMIAKLANLLRSTLDAPDKHQVTLTDEINLTNEYVAVEQIRFGSRLSVYYEMNSDIAAAQVPRFLLQPLVENAIRYGIAKRKQGGRIDIRATRSGGSLLIEVQNEGVQKMPSKAAIGADGNLGLGLKNTRTRLQEVYGDAATMGTFSNEDGTYTVSISVPFNIGQALGSKSL